MSADRPNDPLDSTDDAVTSPRQASEATNTWNNIAGQLKRNSVAYVSLFIAVTGLLYNTWRNETSEAQRNTRSAAFFAIEHLADFQSLVNDIVYSDGCASDRDIEAWGHIKALETLAGVLPEAAMIEIGELGIQWAGHAAELCNDAVIATRRKQIDQQILFPQVEKANAAIIALVKDLD